MTVDPSGHSQYGRGQSALLMQPFSLPQPQHLPVCECVHLRSEELQGGRFQGQCTGQLLPHHLHDLGPPQVQLCALTLGLPPIPPPIPTLSKSSCVARISFQVLFSSWMATQ